VLVMTATPIPRTVAMTVYGDLEVSTLRELPRGRSPIASHVVAATEQPALLDRAWQRVREEVAAGHQVYVVCPRIGDEEAAATEDGRRPPVAVLEVAESLAAGPLAGLRVGVLHGRLPSDEKDAVMRSFAAGSLDVLVATTVIEVGVDVPNATMMVVLDADRFGVSQLHQLRGRVGRGSQKALCVLVTEAAADSEARERLDAVASTLDGFQLAELDLAQRREGDVLGVAQSGRRKQLQLLSLLRDADLIGEARAEAEELLTADPELSKHPGLAAVVAALVDAEQAEYLEKT
jgi:ATP-dependent DNA helicase RecG